MSAAYCHVDKPNSPGCFRRMPKGHVSTYHVCNACGESWPGGPVKAPQNAREATRAHTAVSGLRPRRFDAQGRPLLDRLARQPDLPNPVTDRLHVRRHRMTPQRIQLSRRKGFRLPLNAKSVARPHKWGNPFKVGKILFLTGKRKGEYATAADVVEMYRNTCQRTDPAGVNLRELIRKELAGHDLACWCPLDQPCHADVLLEIANPKEQP